MKYIAPVLDVSGETTAARYQAHRSAWGKRSIQFFDISGASTLWDELRRIKFHSSNHLSLSAYAKQLHSAACTNDYGLFLKLLDQNLEYSFDDSTPPKELVSHRISVLYSGSLVLVDEKPRCALAAKEHREYWENKTEEDPQRAVSTQVVRRLNGILDHDLPIDTHPHHWALESKAPSKKVAIA